MRKMAFMKVGGFAIAFCCFVADFALAAEDTERLNGFWNCIQGSEYVTKELDVRNGALSLISPEGSSVIGRIERVDGNDIYISVANPDTKDHIRFMNYNWFAMGQGPSHTVCRREDQGFGDQEMMDEEFEPVE